MPMMSPQEQGCQYWVSSNQTLAEEEEGEEKEGPAELQSKPYGKATQLSIMR